MQDLVVYGGGGGMRGIFGAGVLHALAGLGARERVEALYGISAGAFNVAHFALGTTARAMEWYLFHVPERGIVDRINPLAVLRGEDVIDVPEAERVLSTERLIDAEALAVSPCPVSFGVVDRTTLTFRWIDARRPDAIRLLLASSTIFPFVRHPITIDGTPCIDGGYRESVCYHRLRNEHRDARLLLVLNDGEDESHLRRLAMGALLRRYDEHLAAVWLDTIDHAPAELAASIAGPRTMVIRPDGEFPVTFATTDAATLAYGFWLGYRAVLRSRDRLQRFLAA